MGMIYLSLLLSVGAIVLLLWMRRSLEQSFKALSYELLERNSRSFLDAAKEQMAPLQESLKAFDQETRKLEAKREGAYVSLGRQIELLGKEAGQLASALKAPKTQGSWGQMSLKRCVEVAGLTQGIDFDEQVTLKEGERVLRPDLVVHLPGNRSLVVDAKAPLDAYLGALGTVHAASLRKHVKDLIGRDYGKALPSAPDFTILFLPLEGMMSMALEQDPMLLDYAAEARVIVATPMTLVAILRAVAYSWRQEKFNEEAREILQLGRELSDRFGTFSEHWSKVGRLLNQTVDAYNVALSSWDSRLFVTVRKLHETGDKAAPAAVTVRAKE